MRRDHGWLQHEVYCALADPNRVVIVNQVADLAQTSAYFTSDVVRTAVARSGVQGPPESSFLDEIETRSY